MSMTSCDLFFGENDPPIVIGTNAIMIAMLMMTMMFDELMTSWPPLHQHINNDVGGNDGDDDDGNDGDGHLSIGINVGQKSSSREKCCH